jgi:hypothetical protein
MDWNISLFGQMASWNSPDYYRNCWSQGHDFHFYMGCSDSNLFWMVQAGVRIMTREIFISKSTRIGMPIVVLFGIIGCSWWIRGEIDDYKTQQAQNFNDLYKHIDQRYWENHGELVNFAYNLDQQNRFVMRGDGRVGLIVPPVVINPSSSSQIP